MSGNSWAGKHKEELLAAAALTAVAVGTGGFGLLGAGAAAGAGAAEGAALGAGAGFGADAAVGAGMGGSAASAFAPTAAQAATTGGLLGGSAATPFMTAGGAMTGGALSMPELTMAAGGASPGLLSQMQGAMSGMNVGNGLDAFGKASKFAQMGQQQPQGQAMARLPQSNQGQVQSPGVLSFMQMYGQPVVDPETLRRRQRQLAMMQQGGFNG